MTGTQLPARRRVTIVEVVVAGAAVLLFALIVIPLFQKNGSGEAKALAERDVQGAVLRYYTDTHVYPTFGLPPNSEIPDPWQAGSLPSVGSSIQFAGLNFDAVSIRLGSGQNVRLYPDYLQKKPKYMTDVSADGIRRWRIDAQGKVTLELNGRSY